MFGMLLFRADSMISNLMALLTVFQFVGWCLVRKADSTSLGLVTMCSYSTFTLLCNGSAWAAKQNVSEIAHARITCVEASSGR